MLEYVDIELVKSSILLIIILCVINMSSTDKGDREFRLNSFSKIMMLIITLTIFYDAYTTEESVYKNINSFKKNHLLYCKEQGSKYHVSIKDGWVVDKNYFYKDSLMIRADRCEEE